MPNPDDLKPPALLRAVQDVLGDKSFDLPADDSSQNVVDTEARRKLLIGAFAAAFTGRASPVKIKELAAAGIDVSKAVPLTGSPLTLARMVVALYQGGNPFNATGYERGTGWKLDIDSLEKTRSILLEEGATNGSVNDVCSVSTWLRGLRESLNMFPEELSAADILDQKLWDNAKQVVVGRVSVRSTAFKETMDIVRNVINVDGTTTVSEMKDLLFKRSIDFGRAAMKRAAMETDIVDQDDLMSVAGNVCFRGEHFQHPLAKGFLEEFKKAREANTHSYQEVEAARARREGRAKPVSEREGKEYNELKNALRYEVLSISNPSWLSQGEVRRGFRAFTIRGVPQGALQFQNMLRSQIREPHEIRFSVVQSQLLNGEYDFATNDPDFIVRLNTGGLVIDTTSLDKD